MKSSILNEFTLHYLLDLKRYVGYTEINYFLRISQWFAQF